jgi:general secretion pathway protein L
MASSAETLFKPLREAADRLGAGDFLRWWWSELRALVPAQWRKRFEQRMAIVAAEGDEWRCLKPVSGRLAESGRVNVGSLDPAGRRLAFSRLVEDGTGVAGNVWLALAPHEVLVRPATLPLAAEEALRDAVGFELDRLTPFAAEQAWFDFRVTSRDTIAGRIALDLAAVLRRPVEARMAELREMGATVLGVGVVSDLAMSPMPFNLLPPEKRERPATSRSTVAARSLAVFVAALALAAVIYPLWLKRSAVIELQPRMDSSKAGADVAERLAREIEKLASEHNFLVAKKQGQYSTLSLLEDLSRVLPDTTWIQQLDVKSGTKVRELQLSGETGTSSKLFELLEQSGSLVNPTFKSALTKGVTPNTERFLLAAEVKPRALPEPLAESTLAPLANPAAPVVAPAVAPGVAPAPAPGVAPAPGAAPAPPASAPPMPAPPGTLPPVLPPVPPPASMAPAAKPAAKG